MEAATLPIQNDYEIERGKPMPSRLHAVVQMRLTVYLSTHYDGKFEFLPELSLDTPGQKSTPDIAIDEYGPIDFSRDEITSHYRNPLPHSGFTNPTGQNQ